MSYKRQGNVRAQNDPEKHMIIPSVQQNTTTNRYAAIGFKNVNSATDISVLANANSKYGLVALGALLITKGSLNCDTAPGGAYDVTAYVRVDGVDIEPPLTVAGATRYTGIIDLNISVPSGSIACIHYTSDGNAATNEFGVMLDIVKT